MNMHESESFSESSESEKSKESKSLWQTTVVRPSLCSVKFMIESRRVTKVTEMTSQDCSHIFTHNLNVMDEYMKISFESEFFRI